jgi:signal transduction histidine kinase
LRNRFGQYAQGRAIELVLPDQPPRVWADPIQLREVLANLVSNAVRYLDKEPGKIDISYRPAGEFYEFCVADNGPGIPEAWHERIFEPFVRGPAAGRDQAGTGLGLSFVRSVIEQGGGRVWLTSQHGLGSRFFFTVRRSAPATRESRSSTP